MVWMRLAVLAAAAAACGGSTPVPTTSPAAPAPAAQSEPAKPPAADEPAPPIAARRPHDVAAPAGTRSDPYYWLRDDTRKDPDMLGYLKAEQHYTEAMLAASKASEDKLFDEIKGRVAEDDTSVPVLDNGYWYYTRVVAGKQNPIHARRKAAMTAPEEVLLDGNALGEGKSFYSIGGKAVSPDNKLLAWVDDSVGRRQYTLHVKNLATGQLLPDTATNVATELVWANDNQTVFLVGKDPTTLRTDRVLRKKLGSEPVEAFREPDGSYYVSVADTKSRKYIEIIEAATTNTETLLIDANRPASAPRVFLPHQPDILYTVDHLGGRFVMRTNDCAKNYRLVEVADGKQADHRAWKDVIAPHPDVFVGNFAVYDRFIAATIRSGGLSKVQVVAPGKPAYVLDAPELTYVMSVDDTPDADAEAVRYNYSSLVRPSSVYEADVTTRAPKLLKQQPVPTYDPEQYTSEYVHATASDGTQVPISLVYKKTTKRDGSAPLWLYGYGSYGISMDPWFYSVAISMLDRGWVYGIAHIRGGQEMGRAWYEDGKLMHKKNTFTDFIAATEYLVAQKYAARDQVFAVGGSAGGLLMGAVLNLRPDLYRGVASIVPFVDVVTTMLDESIPLTTNEFDEWGNPKNADAYNYMLSYSPYDNVRAQDYPSIYVHTGLWDSQVQYYEPTKWVAKLRATKTDRNLLLLDIDMTSGHGGASGRFDRLRQDARMLAFFLAVSARPDSRAALRH